MFRKISRLSIAIALTLSSGVIPAASQTAAPETAASLAETETTHTYNILMADIVNPPRVKVSVELPKTWIDSVSSDGEPGFTVPGISEALRIYPRFIREGDDAERIEMAIGRSYDNNNNVIREALPDGRMWTSKKEGTKTLVRIYVPTDGGFIIGVATLDNATDEQLAEVRAVFETIRQAAP